MCISTTTVHSVSLQPPPLLSVDSYYMESLVTGFFDSVFSRLLGCGTYYCTIFFYFQNIEPTVIQTNPPSGIWRDALDVFV